MVCGILKEESKAIIFIAVIKISGLQERGVRYVGERDIRTEKADGI